MENQKPESWTRKAIDLPATPAHRPTSRLRRFWCLLTGGHHFHLKSDAHPEYGGKIRTGRIYEICVTCGYDRPGWQIDLLQTEKLEKKRLTAAKQRAVLEMQRRRRA